MPRLDLTSGGLRVGDGDQNMIELHDNESCRRAPFLLSRTYVTDSCVALRWARTARDAAVAVLALGQLELHEDVTHVGLDRALAQIEALGDAHVR
jgi:hypothetical protein